MERRFYEIECAQNRWSVRELQRQYDAATSPASLALSRDKAGIQQLAQQGQRIETPIDVIKDPYVLESDCRNTSAIPESELEQHLIDKLAQFLLELGKGFTFVGPAVRITFLTKNISASIWCVL